MKKLAVINGLRGYAILGVIFFHLVGAFFYLPGSDSAKIGDITVFPLTFLGSGWLGVDLFFILSGFVLYLPYALGKRKIVTRNDWKDFYLKRAERLLPLYYIVAIISIIFIVRWSNIHEETFWKEVFLMATITFNFTKETFIPQSNYVLWSLGIEVLFSLIFPVLILGIAKQGIYKVSLAVFAISLLTRIYAAFSPEYDVAPHLNMIKDSVLGRLDDFILGMLICHWFVTNWRKTFFEKNAVLLFAASIVVLFFGCNFSDYIFLGMLPRYYEPLQNTAFQLGFGLITISLLYMGKNVLYYLFANKFLQLCGMMCYSLYVWHGNLRMIFFTDYTPLRFASYFFFLFALAFLSYRYIEFGEKKLKDILPKD
ncbi:MAG TPA: acyltransferase [Chitinophagales bacterium]